ncbi:MAG: hypothetical protein ACR2KW_07390, partial [Rubrobacter sp.]
MIDLVGLWKKSRRRLEAAARRNDSVRRSVYRGRGFVHDLRLRLSSGNVSGEVPAPEKIVWIFCTSRSGSSWLRAMLKDLLAAKVWEEPKVGQLFGLVYAGAQ